MVGSRDGVFLITGATTGIGEATARRAAEAGYRLVLAARSEPALADLAAELGGPARAMPVRCDVTNWDDQQELVRRALEAFGAIDVVMANAGFGSQAGFQEGSVDEWRSMVLTNVYGVALTIRATMDALRERRGHLLLMGSVAGRKALKWASFYGATKHAVTAMGESARQELHGTGVRVTVIQPGLVHTPFHAAPLSIRALDADDVARAIMWAVEQPPHVDVNEILIRPTEQPH